MNVDILACIWHLIGSLVSRLCLTVKEMCSSVRVQFQCYQTTMRRKMLLGLLLQHMKMYDVVPDDIKSKFKETVAALTEKVMARIHKDSTG